MPAGEEVLQEVYRSTDKTLKVYHAALTDIDAAYSDTQYALFMLQKNYPYTIHPFGMGNLTTDGVQWSVATSASATATTKVIVSSTIEAPGIDETIDEVEFGLTARIRSDSSTGTTVSFRWQAKDQDNTTWTNISTARKMHSTTFVTYTMSGRFLPVANFNVLPFNLRLVMKTGTATVGIAQVKNSSYIRVKCKS